MYSFELFLVSLLLAFIIFTNPIYAVAQIGSGYLTNKIVCSDLVLVKKLSDDKIVCVKSETADKLVKRGWSVTINATNNAFNKPALLFVSKGYNSSFDGKTTIENQTASKYPFLPNLIKKADYVAVYNSKIPSMCDICTSIQLPNPRVMMSHDLANLMISDSNLHFIKGNCGNWFANNIGIADNFYYVVISE